MKRKILFIGTVNSPHVSRWIDLIADQGWDLYIFCSYDALPHYLTRNITVYRPWVKISLRKKIKQLLHYLFPKRFSKNVESNPWPIGVTIKYIFRFPIIWPLDRIFAHIKCKKLGESDTCAPFGFSPYFLKTVIKELKPDLIHSMGFMLSGYLTLRAKEIMQKEQFPTWLATNWGSDIFLRKNFPDHRSQIIRLLNNIDYYSCECQRDVVLAREMGFAGKAMPVLPNTGGFDIARAQKIRDVIKPAARRVIMVRGYQHFAGRALTALEAILDCQEALKSYTIIVYSASPETCDRVKELRECSNLDIMIASHLSHDEMLQLFSTARIYLGVSISDGISTSMLEAMTMGAFPIQTNTACCDEWIRDGESGFIIPADDVKIISDRLRQAINNDSLVDAAAKKNWIEVCARLDKKILRKKVVEFYDQTFVEIEERSSLVSTE
ncbi:MAG: glycosyltransferase family 4 protein [Gammaproteobacteria bacterium]|nr:glycosyltransferase family 4 protein [Gammaproteobacteria bacterium]